MQRGPAPRFLLDPAPGSVWPNRDDLYREDVATSPAEQPEVATSPVDSEADIIVDTVGDPRSEEKLTASLLLSPADPPPRRTVSAPVERLPRSPAEAAAESTPAAAATSQAVEATSPASSDDDSDEDRAGSSHGSHFLLARISFMNRRFQLYGARRIHTPRRPGSAYFSGSVVL